MDDRDNIFSVSGEASGNAPENKYIPKHEKPSPEPEQQAVSPSQETVQQAPPPQQTPPPQPKVVRPKYDAFMFEPIGFEDAEGLACGYGVLDWSGESIGQFIGTSDPKYNYQSIELKVLPEDDDDMTVVYVFEGAGDGQRRLVGFNITCDHDDEGSVAFDTGAMLVMQIERGLRERLLP